MSCSRVALVLWIVLAGCARSALRSGDDPSQLDGGVRTPGASDVAADAAVERPAQDAGSSPPARPPERDAGEPSPPRGNDRDAALTPPCRDCEPCIVRVHGRSGAAAPDGLTWPTAFVSLHEGLERAGVLRARNACDVVEVWLAAGTYTACAPGAREQSFELPSFVHVLGGFEGVEERAVERGRDPLVTRLSGDALGDDTADWQARLADNCQHVVQAQRVRDATLSTLTIAGGHADDEGAAASGAGLVVQGGSIELEDVVFEHHLARGNGGALLLSATEAVLRRVHVRDAESEVCGGALALIESAAQLDDVVIEASVARQGGGVCQRGGALRIADSRLLRNLASAGGGGLASTGGRLELVASQLVGNVTLGEGGGALLSGSDALLERVRVLENEAQSGQLLFGLGGGLAVDDDSLLEGRALELIDNHADESGGGILHRASVGVLEDVLFDGNSAEHGGGLHTGGELDLSDARFERNTCTADGAALRASWGPTRIDRSVFRQNRGASTVYLWDGGAVVTNSVFASNTTTSAALEVPRGDSASEPVALANVTFFENDVALLSQSTRPVEIVNALFWRNDAPLSGTNVSVRTSCVDSLDAAADGGGNVSDCRATNMPTPFVEPANLSDLHLGSGSPAIDSGDSDAAALQDRVLDLAGEPRIAGASVDMGAYETQ